MAEQRLPILDEQMCAWSTRLVSHVRVDPEFVPCLASTLARETRSIAGPLRAQLTSDHGVAIEDRLDELRAFQGFMDLAHSLPTDPRLARAQVIAQNYVCFVYLGESVFRVLRKLSPSGTVARRCSTFLTDNPVRAFRNAVAHASWRYNSDFSGLEFWARKGGEPDEPLAHWEASQDDVAFWQALARCVAYAVLPSI